MWYYFPFELMLHKSSWKRHVSMATTTKRDKAIKVSTVFPFVVPTVVLFQATSPWEWFTEDSGCDPLGFTCDVLGALWRATLEVASRKHWSEESWSLALVLEQLISWTSLLLLQRALLPIHSDDSCNWAPFRWYISTARNLCERYYSLWNLIRLACK